MKKSFFLFILLISSACVFANTKLYVGGCTVSELYSKQSDYTKACGVLNNFGGNLKVDSSYKYIKGTTSVVGNDKYFHIDNELKLKWNIFYIGSFFDYSTRINNDEMCRYIDVCLGLDFSKDIFSWLTVGGDFKIGYSPLNIIGRYNNNDCFITALKLNVDIKEYVHFYCGVECTQIKKDIIIFNPLTIKNMIGLSAEYFWNRFGLFGSIDYYCLHPEHAYEWELTNVNQNRFLMSVGVAIKIH